MENEFSYVQNEEHYLQVIEKIKDVRHHLWIGTADIKDVENALYNGKQVLGAVDGGELIGNKLEELAEDIIVGEIADHCVVVLTCDVSENEISLFDPAYGDIPLTLSIDRFCDAWADSGNYMTTVY